MAKKKTRTAGGDDPQKKKLRKQLQTALKKVNDLQATVKTLHESAYAASFWGGQKMVARKRRKR